MKYNVKVSIIIPVYNVEPYLRKCLDSVINQTLKEIEIICIDDCSTDNSLNILKKYKEKYDKIKIIKHEKNRGLGPARNTGMKYAIGEYIGFIDSDDYVSSDYYEQLYNTAKKYDSDIVTTLNVCHDENGKIYDKFMNINKFISEKERNNKRLYIEGKSFVSIKNEKNNTKEYMYVTAWNKIYKKSFLLNRNLFFMDIESGSEDLDLYIRILLNAPKTSYNHTPIYYHRKRSDSLMANRNIYIKHSMCTIELINNSINYCKKYYPEYIEYVYSIGFKNIISLLNDLRFKNDIYEQLHLLSSKLELDNMNRKILNDVYYCYYLTSKSHDKYEGYLLTKILLDKINDLYNNIDKIDEKINREIRKIKYNRNRIKFFGIYNTNNYIFIYLFGIKFFFRVNENIINKISWWIPVKKWRESFRNKFKK